MKVNNNNSSPLGSSESAKSSRASGLEGILDGKKSKDSNSAVDSSSAARVDLSSRAQDIKKAKELAMSGNDVDEAKVARLQALIDAGNYKVDAEAVADRLLDEHSKMP